MVVGGADVRGPKLLGELARQLPIAAVEDGGAGDTAKYMQHHGGLILAAAYGVGELGAEEALAQERIARAEVQHAEDLPYRLLGSGSGEG